MPRFLALTAFAVLSVATFAVAQDTPVVDPAIATMSNDELVAARQAAMKEDGKALRQASQGMGDNAEELATTVLQNFINFPALFKEGSLTDKSHALPIIWQQWDQFDALLKKGQGLAADMQAAAEAGDADSWNDAVKSFGGLCGECHHTYRASM